MNTFRTEPIVLSGEQFMKLADFLRRPDKEYLDRRDAVFARMDEEISIKRDGMDMEVEIPDLDLSFIDEMQENKRSTCSFTIELSEEVSYVINANTVPDVFNEIAESMLKTVRDIIWDCAYSMVNIGMSQCVYNEVGVDKSGTYVKANNDGKMMQPCKIEQITCAA